jgi:hypothetical protein
MTEIWALAALWLGLALIATLLSIWLRIYLPRHLLPRELDQRRVTEPVPGTTAGPALRDERLS